MSAITAHQQGDATDVFGFWMYILTDCILFASLFATYLVLAAPGAYGPALREFIDLPFVLAETIALLTSNLTFGLAVVALRREEVRKSNYWLLATFVLGALFVAMELNEFHELAQEGFAWHASGAASAFFTLVGTHGLHVSAGLLWILVTMVQLWRFGSHAVLKKRVVYLGMFWNFLDIVWIFLFSIVYLMGAL